MKKNDDKDKQILSLNKSLVDTKIYETKYDSALAIIDSFKARTLKLEDIVESKESDITKLKTNLENKCNELNDYIIRFRDMDGTIKSIEARYNKELETQLKSNTLFIENKYKAMIQELESNSKAIIDDLDKRLKQYNSNIKSKILAYRGSISKGGLLTALDIK
jgi:hypothetical protein